MTHRMVLALVVVSIAVVSDGTRVAGQRSGGPGARRNVPVAGSGTIVGRVFDASTRAPVRRAQISATNDDQFLDATSDEEGRFQLSNLTPGKWQVVVQKGGYFPWHVGQRRAFDIPPPVTITARQRLAVEVPLTRGGVIMGRVFDESGDPLAGLTVRVYRARMSQGYRRLESVGIADRTDDTGAYRIYALPPGDYYVGASLRMATADSIVETTYAPTYYPGTGDLGEAQRVRIGLGTEATAVFPLRPIRHVRVSGVLLTSSGSPANAFVNLVSENGELGLPYEIGAVTRADGSFTMADVSPGRYTLNASLRGDGPSEVASMPLTVGSTDITGLSLVTERPGRIRGRFVADTGVARPLPADLEVTAMAAKVNGTVVSYATGSPFELDEIDEPFYLRVNVPPQWTVKRIEIGGVDVTDARVNAAALGQQTDARIVITDRVTTVGGSVARAGQPAKAHVVVFADDPAKWQFPARYVRRAETDGQGRFQIDGLPPYGRYLAVAADYLEDGEQFDPEFLERVREAAFPFSLGEGDTRAIDLPLLER